MSPRNDAEVWEQVTHDAALAHSTDGPPSPAELLEVGDRGGIDDLLSAARERLATSARVPVAAGSVQPLQAEVMAMDRVALLARLALAVRSGSRARASSAVELLSDDELRQLIIQTEG